MVLALPRMDAVPAGKATLALFMQFLQGRNATLLIAGFAVALVVIG